MEEQTKASSILQDFTPFGATDQKPEFGLNGTVALYEPKYRSTVHLEPLLFLPSHEAVNRPLQSPSGLKLTLPNHKLAPQYSNPSSPVSPFKPQNSYNLHDFVFFRLFHTLTHPLSP